MEYFTLNNGRCIPVLGYGCNTLGRSVDDWQMEPDGDYRPLYYALNAGHRYFDAAVKYHNESAMGLFLHESGIERGELFLSTKIPLYDEYVVDAAATRACIERSMARFYTDYLDLLLIHGPRRDDPAVHLAVWRVMEEMYNEGKLRSIGVSNFEIPELEHLLAHARVKPAVNQVMINLGVRHREVCTFCCENDIRPAAWSPLRNLTQKNVDELGAIGTKYGKSWAQVLLRFYIQNGIVVETKSHYENEVVEAISIFDFRLTEEELARIDRIEGADLIKHV